MHNSHDKCDLARNEYFLPGKEFREMPSTQIQVPKQCTREMGLQHSLCENILCSLRIVSLLHFYHSYINLHIFKSDFTFHLYRPGCTINKFYVCYFLQTKCHILLAPHSLDTQKTPFYKPLSSLCVKFTVRFSERVFNRIFGVVERDRFERVNISKQWNRFQIWGVWPELTHYYLWYIFLSSLISHVMSAVW